ncbi:hypothetical protein AAC387_Pa01g1463 [Persea americana]
MDLTRTGTDQSLFWSFSSSLFLFLQYDAEDFLSLSSSLFSLCNRMQKTRVPVFFFLSHETTAATDDGDSNIKKHQTMPHHRHHHLLTHGTPIHHHLRPTIPGAGDPSHIPEHSRPLDGFSILSLLTLFTLTSLRRTLTPIASIAA